MVQKQKTKAKKSVVKTVQKSKKESVVKKENKVESAPKTHKLLKIAIWTLVALFFGMWIIALVMYQCGDPCLGTRITYIISDRFLTMIQKSKNIFLSGYGIGIVLWGIVLFLKQKKTRKTIITFCVFSALVILSIQIRKDLSSGLSLTDVWFVVPLFIACVLLPFILAENSKKRLWYLFYLLFGILYAVMGQITDYMTRVEVAVRIEDVTGTDFVDKPIIYLYPTEKMDVSVKVGHPEKFVHTYPKYKSGWWVEANPNGDLVDKATGRKLYALYWEGKETDRDTVADTGFVVAGEQTIPFLEEKLARLGLTEREADEFIIYWLPKLEKNRYNFIRFQTKAEQDESMPLNIEPQPDTVIRVMMEYDDLDEPMAVNEQMLPEKPVRNGFTVVEWGGTEIDVD